MAGERWFVETKALHESRWRCSMTNLRGIMLAIPAVLIVAGSALGVPRLGALAGKPSISRVAVGRDHVQPIH
jgi:hypothetical protein